jgi:hypothetical protein
MNPVSRDRIGVHAAAEMFLMMSEAELLELGKDIDEHGLRHPVVIFCDRIKRSRNDYARLDEMLLLDGRNRLSAMEAAGIRLFDEEAGTLSPDIQTDGDDPIEIIWRGYDGGSDVFDPFAYVVSANLHRRHLTADQKREVIAALLKSRPERSDRATAKIAKVSDKTVGAVRAELSANAEIPHKTERTETTGRKARGRKPAVPKAPSEPRTPPSQAPDKAMAVVVDSGPVTATLKLREVPPEKWLHLMRVRRDCLHVHISYDCRCLVEFVDDAKVMWEPLGFTSADDMIRNGYDLSPEEIRIAVEWLLLNPPDEPMSLSLSLDDLRPLDGDGP